MKKTTVTLSLKERYTVGIIAKQLHTTRSCVMYKALHVYAKALRHQRIRKELVRCVQLGSKTTMSLKDRMVLRGLLRGAKKPLINNRQAIYEHHKNQDKNKSPKRRGFSEKMPFTNV